MITDRPVIDNKGNVSMIVGVASDSRPFKEQSVASALPGATATAAASLRPAASFGAAAFSPDEFPSPSTPLQSIPSATAAEDKAEHRQVATGFRPLQLHVTTAPLRPIRVPENAIVFAAGNGAGNATANATGYASGNASFRAARVPSRLSAPLLSPSQSRTAPLHRPSFAHADEADMTVPHADLAARDSSEVLHFQGRGEDGGEAAAMAFDSLKGEAAVPFDFSAEGGPGGGEAGVPFEFDAEGEAAHAECQHPWQIPFASTVLSLAGRVAQSIGQVRKRLSPTSSTVSSQTHLHLAEPMSPHHHHHPLPPSPAAAAAAAAAEASLSEARLHGGMQRMVVQGGRSPKARRLSPEGDRLSRHNSGSGSSCSSSSTAGASASAAAAAAAAAGAAAAGAAVAGGSAAAAGAGGIWNGGGSDRAPVLALTSASFLPSSASLLPLSPCHRPSVAPATHVTQLAPLQPETSLAGPAAASPAAAAAAASPWHGFGFSSGVGGDAGAAGAGGDAGFGCGSLAAAAAATACHTHMQDLILADTPKDQRGMAGMTGVGGAGGMAGMTGVGGAGGMDGMGGVGDLRDMGDMGGMVDMGMGVVKYSELGPGQGLGQQGWGMASGVGGPVIPGLGMHGTGLDRWGGNGKLLERQQVDVSMGEGQEYREAVAKWQGLALERLDGQGGGGAGRELSLKGEQGNRERQERERFWEDGVARWEIRWEDIQLGQEVGHGACGTVYHGTWNGSDVAVKVFARHDISADFMQDFKKEIRIMEKLRHPNILLFMGAVASLDHLAIVTEFLPRGSLFRLLHRRTAGLTRLRLLRMALDVARGVNYLHKCSPPVVHHDLKSANLLVDRNWTVKVGDFGLSKMKFATYLSARSGRGTPQWMAPEVLRNEPSNEKSDVYSFGVVLWEMATRQVPWEGMNPMQVVGAVGFLEQQLPLPPSIDPAMRTLISDCWRSPNEWPSFDEITARLKIMVQEQEQLQVDGRRV
ncbi:unnamed protein product [Closterium sp. Naga37s-1]|nr:unnamed protein product [Closterium sp. Naga37s-1]